MSFEQECESTKAEKSATATLDRRPAVEDCKVRLYANDLRGWSVADATRQGHIVLTGDRDPKLRVF